MEIHERIKILIDIEGYNESSFSKLTGISQRSVNYYISGKQKMGIDSLSKILSAFPKLSAEWLMRGEGEIYKTATNAVNIDVSSNKIGDVTNSGQLNIGHGNIISSSGELDTLKEKVEEQKKVINERNRTIVRLNEKIDSLQHTIEKQQNTISKLVDKL